MIPRSRMLLRRGLVLLGLVLLIFVASPYVPSPVRAVSVTDGHLASAGAFYGHKEQIKHFLQSLGPYSSAAFILLQAGQVVLSPIPGELTGIVGGYAYGAFFGFILSTLGLTLGSWLVFELARILGRPFIERVLSKKILDRFNFLSKESGALICFVLFALPGFPKDALAYMLGVSRMRFVTFMLVSTFGRMPGTYVLSLQGAKLRNEDYITAAVVAAVCGLLLLFTYVYRERLFNSFKRPGALLQPSPVPEHRTSQVRK